jgi:uncharacterized glyoxalase superfamily protein PhnB
MTIREVFPILCVRGAAEAIEYYKRVFGAAELLRLADPGGRVSHAELRLGPVTIMLADEHPELGFLGPLSRGGTAVMLHLHVDDVDAVAELARSAGATILRGPTDEGHGERQCQLRDPFGHEWLLGHQIEALTPEEIERRFKAQF